MTDTKVGLPFFIHPIYNRYVPRSLLMVTVMAVLEIVVDPGNDVPRKFFDC
jgi:hypothetical protein